MKKALLLIVDGAGLRQEEAGNAVTRSTMPYFFGLMDRHGYAALEASGPPVGLGAGMVGNSEVGHTVIGAGFVPPSSLQRIGLAFEDGSWRRHPLWQQLGQAPRVHIVGLLSDAGVHGHWSTIRQAEELARTACPCGEVVLHLILDGVDSRAGSAAELLAHFPQPRYRIGLVMGRKWFCDRSGNLELTRRFVDAITGATALAPFSLQSLRKHLATGAEAGFDASTGGAPLVRAGEPVLFTAHRADRAQQSAQLLGGVTPVYSLVELGEAVPAQRVFFPTEPLQEGLLFQLRQHAVPSTRIAEECKFPHVTRFLNGMNPPGAETCIRIPTLPDKDLPGHPEMSLPQLLESLLSVLAASTEPQLVVANIANMDQIGHLGDFALARRAAQHVDGAIRRIHDACRAHGWEMVITADHGNADLMLDESGLPFNSHSPHPVPLVVVPGTTAPLRWRRRGGSLANVAPTLLRVMGLPGASRMEEPLIA